ncbi:MAG: SRPBCC domain-containing protein [Chloroflexi bacterium]|nr:SRPBCC domain-containing protein [Chloroflexota bacterium]
MTFITVETTVAADAATVWCAWTLPEHIMQWTHASDDWHAPAAENDLRVSGRFKTTMAAKDGSFSFDFTGTYTIVEPLTHLAYTIDDGRTVDVIFTEVAGKTHVVERFEAEAVNPPERQKLGWQAILDNFRRHVER